MAYDTTRGVYVDGTHYNVPIKTLKRQGEFLDKYANRTEDGILKRELIGTYFNYQIEFGDIDTDTHEALWDVLSEAIDFHTIKMPSNDSDGWYTYEAYVSSLSDNIKRITEDGVEYNALACHFIAKEPAKTP